MTVSNLNPELIILGWSVILYLVQLFAGSFGTTSELGMRYGMSPRDEGREPQGRFVGRILRAFSNLQETYVLFVALALALTLTGRADSISALGAQIWLVARIAHVILYVAGVPVVRTLALLISVVGLLMMLASLIFA